MSETTHTLILIAVIAAVTIFLRFAPFVIFSKGMPKQIQYLGTVLPCAIMGMLVVYCLKNVSFIEAPYAIPEVLAVLFVVLLHQWKHNSLISIAGGTIFYMILIQTVFA